MKFRLVLLTTMAFGLVFASALPASASTYGPYYEKETYAAYLIGAPDLTLYDPVKQTVDGRALLLDNTGLPAYHYRIEFDRNPSKCVAADDAGDIAEVKLCSGTDVVWIATAGPDGFSVEFENEHFSKKYLAGNGVEGDRFHIKDLGASGWYYQFCINGQQGGYGCGNSPVAARTLRP